MSYGGERGSSVPTGYTVAVEFAELAEAGIVLDRHGQESVFRMLRARTAVDRMQQNCKCDSLFRLLHLVVESRPPQSLSASPNQALSIAPGHLGTRDRMRHSDRRYRKRNS